MIIALLHIRWRQQSLQNVLCHDVHFDLRNASVDADLQIIWTDDLDIGIVYWMLIVETLATDTMSTTQLERQTTGDVEPVGTEWTFELVNPVNFHKTITDRCTSQQLISLQIHVIGGNSLLGWRLPTNLLNLFLQP